MSNPTLSINIPTRNNEKTLPLTLEAIKKQKYKDYEIIVIDSDSTDRTLKIAKSYGCKIINCNGFLLKARIEGVKASKGEYVLLLDSDQILESTALRRMMNLVIQKSYDCMWLYERSYNTNKFLPRLYDADRVLVQDNLNEDVVLPRLYARDMLDMMMALIPKGAVKNSVSHDHLIIWKEFQNCNPKVGKVGNAVFHIEPDSLTKMFKKQYRYGVTARKLVESGDYNDLVKTRHSFRRFYWKSPGLSTKAFVLRVLRGVPYIIGYKFGDKK